MKNLVSSPLDISARAFRVLRATVEVPKNSEHVVPIEDIVAHLKKQRPGIQPEYTEDIVRQELQDLEILGLIRPKWYFLPTHDGIKLTRISPEQARDPRFERYLQWYSPEKKTQVAIAA